MNKHDYAGLQQPAKQPRFWNIVQAAAGLLAMAGMLAGCANTLDAPQYPRGQAAAPCQAYPSLINPLAPYVYRVPSPSAAGNPALCNVSSMVLAVHKLGEFRTIYGPEREEPPSEAINPVIASLKSQAKMLACPNDKPDCTPTIKILIFAHGGLVPHPAAIESAAALSSGMLADGYAPVFLVWNSDFQTAYGDRLTCVLEGEENCNYALYFAPVRAVGDVAASVARAPENYGQQAIRFDQSVIRKSGTEYYLTGDDQRSLCKALSDPYCPTIIYPPFTDANEGEYLNARDQVVSERTIGYTAALPGRIVSTAILPEVGAKAWDNMVRRTRLALELPLIDIVHASASSAQADDHGCAALTDQADRTAAQADKTNRFQLTGEGAFSIFFDRLYCDIKSGNFIGASGRPVNVELYFFGHSMGALVGNETLLRHPDLPWRRVVYMAAATPVRDVRLTVAPVLDCTTSDPFNPIRDTAPCRSNVHFYSLMLHPLAESHEAEGFGLVPEGSLLEWVDEMFAGPTTVDDRMFGKWTNAEKAMPLFSAGVRARMTFRVFPAQALMKHGRPPEVTALKAECTPAPYAASAADGLPERCHPIIHGEFTDYSFWRDGFICGPQGCNDAEPAAGQHDPGPVVPAAR